jgi:hypothetical protein
MSGRAAPSPRRAPSGTASGPPRSSPNVGYQWRFGSWRLGGALGIIQSGSYNGGDTFIAPAPIVSYDFGRFMLNGVFFPKVTDVNEIAVLAAYLTIGF